MMQAATNSDSRYVLPLIKPDTVGAEIGVWMASSSRLFLKQGLKKLYMVDPWSTAPYIKKAEEEGFDLANYYDRYAKLSGGNEDADFMRKYESVAQKVIKEFSEFKNVEIRREVSDTFFASLEDNHLDWIYVDGDHSFEGCYRDIKNSLRVVREGGIIICDDYTWTKYGKLGVTKAVDKIARETKLKPAKFGNNQAVFKL